MEYKKEKKIGIKDIASKAGVSIGTVDRVLHNRGEVKVETRKKILRIIEELGYTPNILAKSLSSKKVTRIVVVIPDAMDNNPYWKRPLIGIRQASEELSNYNTNVFFELFDASDEQSYINTMRKVCDTNPDGLVMNPIFKASSLIFTDELDNKKIPYVFIDVNIIESNNLAYFGQDAEQSGIVAAKLMSLSTPLNSTYIILKQSNKKIFSHHIELRIKGFKKYFDEYYSTSIANIIIAEVDLLNPNEPKETLNQIYNENPDFAGVFVPNSRSFILADNLKNNEQGNKIIIGYDLINENLEHLKNGKITYLLEQNPEKQAFDAITVLFNHLILKKSVIKTNYSPINIIVKENINYFN